MISVRVHLYHRDPSNQEVTGYRFEVTYEGGQATVSMLELPSLSPPRRLDSLPEELRRLGQALLDAAGSPEAITYSTDGHPRS